MSRVRWALLRPWQPSSSSSSPLGTALSFCRGTRFCSGPPAEPPGGGPGRTPPKPSAKGFEKFYETKPSKPSKPSKASKPSKPPGKAGEETGEAKRQSAKRDSAGEQRSGSGPAGNFGWGPRQHLIGFAGLAGILLYSHLSREPEDDEITIQEMMREYLMRGLVERIQIVNRSFCRVHLRQEGSGPNAGRVLTIQLGTPEAFEAKVEQLQNEMGVAPAEHVALQYVNEVDLLAEFWHYLPSLLFVIPLLLAARFMSGGANAPGPGGAVGGSRHIFNIGKAFPAGQEVKSTTKFADVAGLEMAKKEVVEFVDFLQNPEKYEKLGARVPKGGLLIGPPGTGKTLLAKAVAGEAQCPFFSMSGSDFIEMFVGVGPSRMRDLFAQARASAPSIIFIDEIDAVGRKRGKGGFSGGGSDERENTLNQLLVEMDGFSSGTGVVVLAGTNRADILDPALTRPGRFDRQIAIDKPDVSEREAIFIVHLKPVRLHDDLATRDVARRMASLTPGFAGSDIANVCNEAAIFAARRSAEAVEMRDFEEATERVIAGLPKNNLLGPEGRRAVALHETGHALVGWFFEHADPLLKISVVPRSSGALGFAQYLPEDVTLLSKEAVLDRIAVSLGGRAAEELFTGKITTGAQDDLQKVTKMAYSMVQALGMNDRVGLLSWSSANPSEQFYKPYSEETGRVIDMEARQIVDEQYARVKAFLLEKEPLARALSEELMKRETLVYTEIHAILGERPYGVKPEMASYVQAGQNPFTGDAAGGDTVAPAGDNVSSPQGTEPHRDVFSL